MNNTQAYIKTHI